MALAFTLRPHPRPQPEPTPEPPEVAGIPVAPMPSAKVVQLAWPDEGREGLPAEVIRQYGSTRFRHREPVIAAGVGPDSALVYTVDKTALYCWEIATGKLKFRNARKSDEPRTEIICHADSVQVVTRGGAVIETYDPQTGRFLGLEHSAAELHRAYNLKLINGPQPNFQRGYIWEFTPDEKVGFLGQPGDWRTLVPIDMRTKLPVAHAPLPEAWCWGIRYHTDGQLMFVSAGGRARPLETTTATDLARGLIDQSFNVSWHTDQLAPDGSFVVGIKPPSDQPFALGGELRMTDPKTGEVLAELETTGKARSNPHTPDSERVFCVIGSREFGNKSAELVEWSVKERRAIRRRAVPAAEDYEVSASPDGRWLACAWREPLSNGGFDPGNVGVEVWDRTKPDAPAKHLVMMRGWLFPVLRFPARGDTLTAVVTERGQPSVVQEWDLSTGERLRTWPTEPRVTGGQALSPDGRMFLSGAENGELYLVELRTGRVRHVFRGHRSAPRGEFSPDGKHIAGVSADAPIYIWDVRGELTRPAAPPDEAALNRAWEALGGEDAEAAFDAIRLVANFPAQSLPFLRAKKCPTKLRAARAVEAVEWIGTPEAVKLLEGWLDGEDDATVIAEATAALARLKKK